MLEQIENKQIRKVGVLRALHLGDLLCAVPAFRALKAALPNAEIALIGLPWAQQFASRYEKYFSRFIRFPGYPGLAEQTYSFDNFVQFARETRAEQFDLLIQMHGSGIVTNPVVSMLGASRLAGYKEIDKFAPAGRFIPYPTDIPEIHRHLKLIRSLGMTAESTQIEIPVTETERASFFQLVKERHLALGNYICIHPGGRNESRRWKPSSFARIADKLAATGAQVVLTGTRSELPIIEDVSRLMKRPAINLGAATDLGVFTEVVKNARMILTNDTGASHVAAAVATPSVVVFVGSDPGRWAPLNKRIHKAIDPEYADDLSLVEHRVYETLAYASARTAL